MLTTLVGQRLESFTRVSTIVRKALEAALLRILTPKKSTDVLREILAAKAAGRAYSIVFVGVNGVGKSTSLSKVAYYLKSKGVKVLIAACDTFRSGAVEQLNQHAKVLDVPLFQKGALCLLDVCADSWLSVEPNACLVVLLHQVMRRTLLLSPRRPSSTARRTALTAC